MLGVAVSSHLENSRLGKILIKSRKAHRWEGIHTFMRLLRIKALSGSEEQPEGGTKMPVAWEGMGRIAFLGGGG